MANLNDGVALLFVAGLLIFWLTPLSAWWMLSSHPDRNARLWFIGTALYAIVATMFVFGTSLPGWIRGPLAYALSLGSLFCMAESLRRELSNKTAPIAIYLLALISYFVFMLILMWAGSFIPYGLVINLIVLSGTEIFLIFFTIKVQKCYNSRSIWLIVVVLLLFVASNLSRAFVFFSTGHLPVLLDFTLHANIAILINILSVIFYCYGYWGFVIEKNRQAALLANERAIEAREKEAIAFASKRFAEEALKERTELLGRLTEATKMAQSGALSAAIAHEINQPIAAIHINTSEAKRMLAGLHDDGTAIKAVANIVDRIQNDNVRIATIIKRIRAIFRDEPINVQIGNIDHMIKNVVSLLRPRIMSQNMDIEMNLNAQTAFRFSPGEIEHVVINILTNALDAVRPQTNPKIAIETWVDGEAVAIAIDDNGPGIGKQRQEVIFELRESSKPTGSGLGLWLSRYIVERHNGSIQATQSALGGARFIIVLPIAA